MVRNTIPIIDSDGHVMEDWDALLQYMPEAYIKSGRFKGRLFSTAGSPTLREFVSARARRFSPSPGRRLARVHGRCRHRAGMLYSTGGLAFGKVITREFAVDVARAWNDWFSDAYLKKSPRFQGLALIPLQEPEEAVEEMRRAVKELNFCGVMLPSTGFKGHLGDKEYWPVYAEANKLGCCIGVHGGAHEGLGMDWLTPYAPINGLGPSLRADGGVRGNYI